VFPTYWTVGYAVGDGGVIVKRVAAREATLLYDTEVANLGQPTLLPSLDAGQRTVFSGNNNGHLFAVDVANRVLLVKPAVLGDAIQGRSPAGTLPSEAAPTAFSATANGIGYAVDAATGRVRWTTDADASTAGIQPLGDVLMASPVIAASANLAFFGTRNIGSPSQLFAFDADTGTCRWVFNGDCNGSLPTRDVGQISAAPIHDNSARRLYVTSTRYAGGDTIWAIDSSNNNPAAIVWSRMLGDSDVSPAFVDGSRSSIIVGTTGGQVYRLQATDGTSCWRSDGSGCGSSTGSEVAFCTATDTLSATCDGGSAITTGFFTIWSGTHAGHLVFVSADGHIRMLDANGTLVWKTAAPIAGASFPLVLADAGKLYVGATDGKLHALDLDTGAETASQTVGDGSATVGSPAYDGQANTITVGTASGKLYQLSLPL